MTAHKRIVIIAGPNGAGKTTFARQFLPNEAACRQFVNADMIAAGLSPFEPEQAALRAARLMHELVLDYARRDESFAFETTLAGKTYARQITEWRLQGYEVPIVFLKLSSVEIAIERVAARVRQGRHYVAEDVIRRRFEAGWRNFQEIYQGIVNSWIVYENSGPEPVPVNWENCSELKTA